MVIKLTVLTVIEVSDFLRVLQKNARLPADLRLVDNYARFRWLLKGEAEVWLRLRHLVTLFWAPCTNTLTYLCTWMGFTKWTLQTYSRDCKSRIRANFFRYRVVNVWNSLPEDVVTASSMNCLKGRPDSLFGNDKYCENWEEREWIYIRNELQLHPRWMNSLQATPCLIRPVATFRHEEAVASSLFVV